MATHSSTLAWKIPWTEELGRLLVNPFGLLHSLVPSPLPVSKLLGLQALASAAHHLLVFDL